MAEAMVSTAVEFMVQRPKYLRYVLEELDALKPGLTILFVDNESAIAMIYENRPTP